jgi:type III restriction enzyme
LIAQVLGRGLRIPPEYKGDQPIVTVFNHDKWSSSIKELVNEVLEIEKRMYSYAIPKDREYNFELYNIDYKKSEQLVETPQVKEYVFNKGFISLNSRAEIEEKTTTYERAVTEKQWKKETAIQYKMYSAEEVALDIFNRFKVFDLDEGTEYSKKYPYEKILAIIKNSLLRIGENKDLVHEQSRQNILQGFGVIGRKKTKSLRYKIEAENLYTVNTGDKNINKDSLGVGALRREHSIFFDDYSSKEGDEEDRKLLKELLEDETLPVYSLQRVENAFNFKTPVNVVFTSYKPERDFIKRLISEENAKFIDAWIKSPDAGFYSIGYSWRKGEHPKQGSFNPDFFIKVGKDILVIEIKQDGDFSAENKAKLRYAKEHFNRLNTLQSEQRYHFKFLSPESYDLLFQRLREGKYQDFTSTIEADLEEE